MATTTFFWQKYDSSPSLKWEHQNKQKKATVSQGKMSLPLLSFAYACTAWTSCLKVGAVSTQGSKEDAEKRQTLQQIQYP